MSKVSRNTNLIQGKSDNVDHIEAWDLDAQTPTLVRTVINRAISKASSVGAEVNTRLLDGALERAERRERDLKAAELRAEIAEHLAALRDLSVRISWDDPVELVGITLRWWPKYEFEEGETGKFGAMRVVINRPISDHAMAKFLPRVLNHVSSDPYEHLWYPQRNVPDRIQFGALAVRFIPDAS